MKIDRSRVDAARAKFSRDIGGDFACVSIQCLVARRFFEFRMRNCISVRAGAALLGCAHSALYDYESGRRTPGRDVLHRMLDVLLEDGRE